MKITPQGIIFQYPKFYLMLSHEAVAFYFKLKKEGRIIGRMSKDGAFIYMGDYGFAYVYSPLMVTSTKASQV